MPVEYKSERIYAVLDFMFSRKVKRQQSRSVVVRPSALPAGNYVVFDIETSGFNPELHKIIEIAAIKVVDGVRVDSYHSLVNYKGKLSSAVIELTGINPDDLRGAPDRRTVLQEFYDFIGDYDLVGHNIAQFDNKFLWFGALSVGMTPKKNGIIDTLGIAKATILADSYKLEYLCRELNINVHNTHRALDDANLTLMLLSKINEQYGVGLLPEFYEYKSTSQFGQRMNSKFITRSGDSDIANIAGKLFCITTFQPFSSFNKESDLQQYIVDAGGQIGNNVTRKTDYLIDCDPVYVSSKEKKALEYIDQGKSGVKIITPEEFMALAK